MLIKMPLASPHRRASLTGKKIQQIKLKSLRTLQGCKSKILICLFCRNTQSVHHRKWQIQNLQWVIALKHATVLPITGEYSALSNMLWMPASQLHLEMSPAWEGERWIMKSVIYPDIRLQGVVRSFQIVLIIICTFHGLRVKTNITQISLLCKLCLNLIAAGFLEKWKLF